MDDIYKLLSEGFGFGQQKIDESDRKFSNASTQFETYLTRAKNTLSNRQAVNPKPAKRFMTTIYDESDDDEPLQSKVKVPDFKVPAARKVSNELPLPRSSSIEKAADTSSRPSGDLRPLRTAKSKANLNLKEVPLGTKMRNNEVVIKKEPSRSLRNSSDSVKENETPAIAGTEKRKSPDEGIQSAPESEVGSTRNSKRSNSVEVISKKLVEIDLTTEEVVVEMMPPPKAVVKKTRTKQKQPPPVVEAEKPSGLRITRSKIKMEKLSMSEISLAKKDEPLDTQSDPVLKVKSVNPINESVASKKPKKKYPMPMLIKVEPEESPAIKLVSPEVVGNTVEEQKQSEAESQICNDTFNVPVVMNTTVTVAQPFIDPNTTVTLAKNVHDSLMTEDNDEDADVSMEVLPPPLPPKKQLKPAPAMKLKKNEVFDPYTSSPVKQRVQAFEKHAVQATPDKYNTMPAKFGSLKNATPSKIAYYTAKTTPLNLNKNHKFNSASISNLVSASAPGHKTTKTLKKGNSLSQETLDEYKKASQANQMMEEKRKAREEKQRLAALHREAMEKEKREQALKTQQERDEKYRKIMREKEEKMKMEALKKKVAKERQARKFAEEKNRNDLYPPKPNESTALSKNDSLHLKMQKQLLLDRSLQKMKEESKNTYSFDMLQTDDSTDDEGRPSAKRPSPPEWSKKKIRKPQIAMQNYVNSAVLDCFFSSKPISVDLREIFPAIDSRKLLRNSSAIWRTPPKQH